MSQLDDSHWMAEALRLAEWGLCTTSPNPRVGCVLVKNGSVVGAGWHERAGEPHAEVHAILQAGSESRGATAYVTLEPCSHHGKTPPCADALVAAGVSRVVVAMEDPNPLVAGRGLAQLREAGIAVEVGLMESAAHELNAGFVARMSRGTPLVRSKIGMSLDGRTALANGVSQWITGEDARRDVQHWRARSCAVLTGVNTVLADDPQLNVRALQTGRQPLRVVLDSDLRMPPEARVLHGGALVYAVNPDPLKVRRLEEAGAEVAVLPDGDGRVDLQEMLQDLARRGCNEVLVEAGATLNGALLQAGLVDEMLLYVAPSLLGDAARGIASLGELAGLSQRVRLHWKDLRQIGDDLRITAKVENV